MINAGSRFPIIMIIIFIIISIHSIYSDTYVYIYFLSSVVDRARAQSSSSPIKGTDKFPLNAIKIIAFVIYLSAMFLVSRSSLRSIAAAAAISLYIEIFFKRL